MLDPKKILDDFLGSNVPGVGTSVRDTAGKATQLAKDNPLATGALAAILLGTGTGREVAGSALKLGGLAAVAGLAYKAYQNYQSGKAPAEATQASTGELAPPPDDSSFRPETAPQGEHEFALVLVRAMIAAARADGMVDETEKARIIEKLSLSGINSDTQEFLANELNSPVDMDATGRGCGYRCAEGRALYRFASGYRSANAGRARLSRPACRAAETAGQSHRSYRSDCGRREGYIARLRPFGSGSGRLWRPFLGRPHVRGRSAATAKGFPVRWRNSAPSPGYALEAARVKSRYPAV